MTLTTITKVKALNAVMAGAVRSDDDPASQREHEAGGKNPAEKPPGNFRRSESILDMRERFRHLPKSLHDGIVASFTLSLRPHPSPHLRDGHNVCHDMNSTTCVCVCVCERTVQRSRGQGLAGPASGRTRWGAADVFRQRSTSFVNGRRHTTAARIPRSIRRYNSKNLKL